MADGRADLAVHSMKDVPAELPPGFVLAAITAREDPRDAFVSKKFTSLSEMPDGATVGTSSLRRQAQIVERHPGLEVRLLRGNVDTRLAKLDRGEYARHRARRRRPHAAGARRRASRRGWTPRRCLPAPGQGALGIECLAARAEVIALLAPLGDAATSACVRAERTVSRALGGSCTLPLAAFAQTAEDNRMRLRALVASSDGKRVIRSELEGEVADPEALGQQVAQDLRRQGRGCDPWPLIPYPVARILVTRPKAQAQRLARLIEEAGGRVHLFPAIEIEDVAPPAALARLHEFDLAVFVSPTAVAKAMPQVRAWPRALRVAAVGSGTRRELEKRGIADVIAPASGADSEALLATPALGDVAGRRIAILRGDGGRALLGETFVARGAHVEYIDLLPSAACPSRRRHSWKPGELAAVTVSSSQGLDNLFQVLDPELLRSTPLFVPHARIAESARTRSVREVVLAGHSDEEMLDRLMAYFRSHG